MTRAYRLLLVGLISVTSGCAMCSSCDDFTYPMFGGRWQRTDMTFGRVGSAFTDVGVDVLDDDLQVEQVEPELAPIEPISEPEFESR